MNSQQDYVKELNRASKRLTLGIRANYANLILWLAAILIVATGLFSVQEFDLSLTLRAISEFVVVLVLYYCVLFSRSEIGKRDGYRDEDYLKAKEGYENAFSELSESGELHRLPEYCSYFVHNELIETRTAILDDVDISYNDVFGDGKLPDELSVMQKRAIRKAKKLKPLHLTRSMLINIDAGRSSRYSIGANPETKRRAQMAVAVIQSFVTLLIAVNFTVKIVEQPTIETFIRIIFQVLCLLMVGWRGYRISFNSVTVDRAHRIREQANHLRAARGYLVANRKEDGKVNDDAITG